METIHEFKAEFRPRTPSVTAATFGQVFIHEVLQGLSPSNGHTNFEIGFAIPGRTLSDVEQKVRHLLEGVESLRTVWLVGEDGQLIQKLLAETLVRIQISSRSPDVSIRDDHRVQPFAQGDLPLRIYLYTGADAWFLSFVISHMSIDKWAREVLREHLERLFLGANCEPASQWHPIDQSLLEHSVEAQSAHQQSESYWRRTLAEFPRSIVDAAPAYSTRSYWWRVQLNSLSLGAAIMQIAARTGLSSSIISLTLGAVVIGAWFKIDLFQAMMLSANRFDRRYARAIGQYAQTVPIALRTHADSFAQLAKENFGAALRAYRYSSVSPYRVHQIQRDLAGAGQGKTLDAMVNVYIFGAFDDLKKACPSTSDDAKIIWISSRDNEISNISFDCNDPRMAILQADTKYVPKNNIEDLLRIYRLLAIRLAERDDVAPRDLATEMMMDIR